MKSKKLYYLSAQITFIILLLIQFTLDSHALTSFNNEEEFLFSAPIAHTETFNGYTPTTDGILPFTFIGTIYDDDIAEPRSWMISPLEPLGWDSSYSYDLNALFSTSVQNDYFSFGVNNHVNAFGFFLFRPYHEETIGGIINIDVIETDGQISTYIHNQDGQWLFFGFITSVGISQVKVYNSIEDGILDTNFAYDNISRSEILAITEPVVSCVTTIGELQTALVQAAGNGRNDVIHLVQGTYTGNSAYTSAEPYGLTIEGGYTDDSCSARVVDPANTVLDGDDTGRVLTFDCLGVAADFAVDGLTLQNGNVNIEGGGLYAVTNGTVTLTNNIISNNTASLGGGLFSRSPGIVTLNNNSIINNTAVDGGGVYFNLPGILNITNNNISHNIATAAGGFVSIGGDLVTLFNNIINHNRAIESGGGVTANHVSELIMVNNIVSYNDALNGGGVFADETDIITLTNNTISYNAATNGGGGFWALLYDDSDTARLFNNIVWNNNAPTGADIYLNNNGDGNISYSSVNLLNNDFDQQRAQPNQGFFITENDFDIDPSNLNNEDPKFDVDGYHLTGSSPCIDAGVDAGVYDDIDGDTRPQGAGYDIGADEYVISDSDGDGIPDAEDACPNSDLSETVIIDSWDTGVDNVLLEDGCTISDLISECAEGADNHGEFVSSVSHTTNILKEEGIIGGKEKGMLQKGAAKAAIP